MNLTEKEIGLINNLLEYDLYKFANIIGFRDIKLIEFTDIKVAKLLNIAERLSRRAISDKEKNLCILVCALIWEYKKSNWFYINTFLIQILTRLGIMPLTMMLDPKYDFDTATYSTLGSYIAELKFTARTIDYEVEVNNVSFVLSKFQKQMWDAIDKFNRLGISAPTSSGKSFILVNKILDILSKEKGDVVYIVPTITLINQVTTDLRRSLKRFNLKNINISQTYSAEGNKINDKNIYVLTQERALSGLNQDDRSFENLKLLLIDEVQNIERVADEDNDRSRDMLATIQEFQNVVKPKKIVITGPRLKNIQEIATKLFGDQAETVSDYLPPVLNLTYSFAKKGSKIVLKQFCPIFPEAKEVEIKNHNIDLKTFGGVFYKNSIHTFMNRIILSLGKDSGTIVFSPTKNQSRKSAMEIGEVRKSDNGSELNSLIDYVKESVHDNYNMLKCLRNGVAYHNASIPLHIRNVIEKAFSKGLINVITCTTTLMQGVNLPAKYIIVRNPKLELKQHGSNLTSYEFANLRGRAGRLMKDFVGRAILLDEKTFNDSDIKLNEYPEKDVKVGYENRFISNRNIIMDKLLNNNLPEIENIEYNDLTILVRYMILKYDIIALNRLRVLGIELTETEFKKIKFNLSKLNIPLEICLKNPHWDPLVLDNIFKSFTKENLSLIPSTPFNFDFVNNLMIILELIKETAEYFYNKYFNFENEELIKKILILSQNWSQENKLKKIISWKNDIDSEEVENVISLINKEVSFSLPKLLRPVVQLQNPDNPILGIMETGAFRPYTRKLISHGISRELSIKISDLYYNSNKLSSEYLDLDEEDIKNFLSGIYTKLSTWERYQINEFLY